MKTRSKKGLEAKRYLNESPAVISMMSSIVTSNGSLDSAVRKVADDGPKNTSSLFRALICDVDSRAECDIRESLLELVSKFPEGLSSFRRALLMTISASDAKVQTEKVRIMSEASEIVLQGIKQTGESYISKLQFPCMAVFGIGIMVPMIVLSLAPMFGIEGMISMPANLDSGTVRFIVLFLVPLCIMAVMLSIRDKNPFTDAKADWGHIWRLLPALVAIPVWMSMTESGFGLRETIVTSVVVGSIMVQIAVNGVVKRERTRMKVEKALWNSLFDLGNKMVTGVNFDTALLEALSIRKECSKLVKSLGREYVLCRGDVEAAVRKCVSPYSQDMADTLCRILVASYRDVRDAGRMATALAHQLQNESQVRNDMTNKLRSMVDMMNGTAGLFAPLILGMSLMMMSPLTEISNTVDIESSFITISIYLIELAVLISMFTSILKDRFRAVNVLNRLSMVLPIAMVILYVCSSITI